MLSAASEYFADLFGGACGRTLMDRIRLESLEDDRTLVLKDGTLVSFIAIDGSMRMLDSEALSSLAGQLRVSLAPFLSSVGHAIEISFSRDPDSAVRIVEQFADRSLRRARLLDLDLADLLNERRDHLASCLVDESCMVAVYTRLDPLADAASHSAAEAEPPEPSVRRGQSSGRAPDSIFARHAALVDALCRDLQASGQFARILDALEALQNIRAAIYPFSAPWKQDWVPAIPRTADATADPASRSGMQRMPETPSEMNGDDFSNLSWPSLDRQLATENGHVEDSRTVRLGGTLLSGFDVTVAPEILTPFNALVDSVTAAPARIAWRCSFLIEAGGLQSLRLKEQYARLFIFSAPTRNGRIRDAIDELRRTDGTEDTVVRLRICFATWTRADHGADLRRNAAILRRAVERWGNSSADGVSGDAFATILGSVPGIAPESTAPPAAAPLSSALAMAPLERQAGPWAEGPILLRTADGKIWPYKPGSQNQNSWANIFAGVSGSGKSVAMNAFCLAAALEPHAGDADRAELPRIAVIDVGGSSKGLISLLKESLPPDRRGEAVHLKLAMTPDHAVNAFDTPLGMRKPPPAQRTFLQNFVSVICDDSEASEPSPLRGLIGATIDEAYELGSDDRSPRRYLEGDDPAVDASLAEIGWTPGPYASWWNAVDALFRERKPVAAAVAQRHAAPQLADLVTASHAEHIASLYGGAGQGPDGETAMSSLHRAIAEAVRDYPMLAGHSKLDFGEARAVSLDLAEVTAGGGPSSSRQAALMFMLARQAATRDWHCDPSEVASAVRAGALPEEYESYHARRATNSARIPKLLCVDEFHRAARIDGFRQQILEDIREGRKRNLRVSLASQLPDDFDDEIMELASGLFIFSAPSEASIRKFAQSAGLNEIEKTILRTELTGPVAEGAPMFCVIRHKSGDCRQKLMLTLGPSELWALSTTAEDVALRELLYEAVGAPDARSALASRFPGGSAKKEIELRLRRREERDAASPAPESSKGVIHDMADELIQLARFGTRSGKSNSGPPQD